MSLSNTLPFGSKASQLLNTSEDEQSPPPTTSNNHLSSSEFSVFANVNIPESRGGATSSSYFASQSTLNSTFIPDDTISNIPASTAPEIPRRSNSIISMTSHNNYNNHFDNNHKPLLSPRMFQQQQQQQHFSISPGKALDALSEDLRSMDVGHHTSEQLSPIHRPNPYQRGTSAVVRAPSITSHELNERSSPGNHPSSPRYNAMELNESNGPLPISPHVNVPNNTVSFNHHSAPPLPPKGAYHRKHPKKNPHDFINSQKKQAADAPLLMPRDKSPPPLPPRHSNNNNSNNNNNNNINWNPLVCLITARLF
jgi:son of sevenless